MWSTLRHNDEGVRLVQGEEGGDEVTLFVQFEHDFKLPHDGDDFFDAGTGSAQNVVQVLGTDDTFEERF